MAMRPLVRGLVKRLANGDARRVRDAAGRARALMILATKRVPDPEWLRQSYADELSEAELDVVLRDEEVDALARALVALVDRPAQTAEDRRLAGAAAWALNGSARLWVVPYLTPALGRWRPADLVAAQQAAS